MWKGTCQNFPIFSVAIVILFFSAICRAEIPSTSVGVIYPLTGHAAEIGAQRLRGAELAVESLKKQSSPLSIKLIIEDSQSDTKTAVSAFQRLVRVEGIQTIFTALSGVSMALRSLAEKEKVLLFANSTHPDVTKNTKYVLRSYFTIDTANDVVLTHTKSKGIRSLVVLHVEDEFGQALVDDLKVRGEIEQIPVKKIISFSKSENDFLTILTRLKASSKIDLLYVVGLGSAVARITKLAREMEIADSILVWAGCSQSGLRGQNPGVFEGVFSIDSALDTKSPHYVELATAYEQTFPGEYLSPVTVAEYDSFKLFGNGYLRFGNEPLKIRDYLASHTPQEGASGLIRFTQSGDARWPMDISRIEATNCKRL